MPNDFYDAVADYDGGCPTCGIILGIILTLGCVFIWVVCK